MRKRTHYNFNLLLLLTAGIVATVFSSECAQAKVKTTIKNGVCIVSGKGAMTDDTSYNKKIKKSAKFVFSASYGISGKSKTQYKIVPKGKKASKYRWKTANKITYKKKNKKVSIYARFIDKCGNITQRKSSGFYITK